MIKNVIQNSFIINLVFSKTFKGDLFKNNFTSLKRRIRRIGKAGSHHLLVLLVCHRLKFQPLLAVRDQTTTPYRNL